MNESNSSITPSSDEKTMASLAHVLQIVGWWIAPLIIYLTKRESKFVSFHAMQALLWQITFLVVFVLGMVVWMIVIFSTVFPQMAKQGAGQAPPTALFIAFPIFWLVFMGLFAVNLTVGIVYGIKAGRGEWASYPVIGGWARRIVGV